MSSDSERLERYAALKRNEANATRIRDQRAGAAEQLTAQLKSQFKVKTVEEAAIMLERLESEKAKLSEEFDNGMEAAERAFADKLEDE